MYDRAGPGNVAVGSPFEDGLHQDLPHAPVLLRRIDGDGADSTDPTAGTPRYMAPEQRAGAEVDGRTDQFAFCVALWEAATGAHPFLSDAVPPAGDAVSGFHLMGGMRMGTDARSNVCDPHGRVHGMDNLFVSDGSVFVTSGSHNPTLTLMAVALRNARHWA